MKIEQFVMAYKVEQDRLRALLPEGFKSIRPVLRINAEIQKKDGDETCDGKTKEIGNTEETETIYIEFNTPVAAFGKRGWLNIASWETPSAHISYERNGRSVSFHSDFLEITYTGVGVEGGCPAESDNDGCFFIYEDTDDGRELRPNESINSNKEFCDCKFKWKFAEGDAHGISIGEKTLPAFPTESVKTYDKQELSAQAAASIKCEQILGSYVVRFLR